MSKWISVKDRLPEPEADLVLAIVSGKLTKTITFHNAYVLAAYNPDDGWIVDQYPEWEHLAVSHWMLLPELPKED